MFYVVYVVHAIDAIDVDAYSESLACMQYPPLP
jgi:hypothetical protein